MELYMDPLANIRLDLNITYYYQPRSYTLQIYVSRFLKDKERFIFHLCIHLGLA